MRISEVDTPALLIDLDALEFNIAKMGKYMREVGCNLRPHIKAHKTPAIAHRQIAAGAIGVTCAKLGEADVMISAGIDNILIANQIVGPFKAGRLVGLAKEASVSVAIDNPSNAEEISKEALRRNAVVGAVVEVDVGMGRAGVPPGAPVLALARKIKSLKGLQFKGVMGYEGHLQQIESFEEREKAVRKSMQGLVDSAKLLRKQGIEVEIVSAGGTNTYNLVSEIEGITESQAGSYMLMDVEHDIEGIDFKHALSVLSTVTSCPDSGRAIMDAGLKCFADSSPAPRSKKPAIEVKYLSEEHGWLELKDGVKLDIGDRLEFYPYYAPTTVNLYDKFYCVRDGIVEVEWSILARGKAQ